MDVSCIVKFQMNIKKHFSIFTAFQSLAKSSSCDITYPGDIPVKVSVLKDLFIFYRYLASGEQIDSKAIIGPENDELLKDETWQTKQGL